MRINVQASPVIVSTISLPDPVDVKWNNDGNVYVLSRSGSSITEFNASGAVIRSLAGVGATPNGLDVDAAGNVYVAVTGANQVKKFMPSGSSFQPDSSFNGTGRIGRSDASPGSASGEFNAPFDVTVTPDGEQIAVSDSSNHRIQLFTKAGGFVDSYGVFGTSLGKFNSPSGLTYDDAGELYIVDQGNNRIVLAPASAFIAGANGTFGNGLNQFSAPLGISTGDRGIYVADTANSRIQIFEPLALASSSQPTPFIVRAALSGEVGLNHPNAVSSIRNAVEETLYIADTGNNRILLVRLPGENPLTTWNAMIQRLILQDIPGAVSYFAAGRAEGYRVAFATIGITELAQTVSQLPALNINFAEENEAEYYFQQSVKGVNLTSFVRFVREHGVWKISEF